MRRRAIAAQSSDAKNLHVAIRFSGASSRFRAYRYMDTQSTESELAYNVNGSRFGVPAHIREWLLRRMRPRGERGGPDVMYDAITGLPQTIPITATMAELRTAVGGVAGRYRLDPINAEGVHDETVPFAYVSIAGAAARNGTTSPTGEDYEPIAIEGRPETIEREAMRLSIRLAETIVLKYADGLAAQAGVTNANAALIRAADGAGMPTREPIFDAPEPVAQLPPPPPPVPVESTSPVMALLMTLAQNPAFVSGVTQLAQAFGGRRGSSWTAPSPAAPWPGASSQSANLRNAAPQNDNGTSSEVDPTARLMLLMQQLTPEERMSAQALAMRLTPDERAAWLAELAALDDAAALARVRDYLGRYAS
ncbi:MAG TPA: hypothetical protein VGM88_13095 [Kofleriaceae bacterium]